MFGGGELLPGPVEWVNRPLDGDRVLTCIQFGLLLVTDGQRRLGVLVRGPAEQTIRREVRRVISLAAEPYGPPSVRFHTLPAVARKDIVLADGVLERVERHTVEFSAHRERLLAAGRHLRRGLLLHGEPGTGRVDLVVEVPLPDAACRRRLLELYGRGPTLRVSDPDRLVEGLEGASPAFIRELLRKAALLAIGSDGEIVVEDSHLATALRDLVIDGGVLGRRLLGMSGRAAGGAPAPAHAVPQRARS